MENSISVIIPYYCPPEELFLRCIDSVRQANVQDIEIIIVDDGSPEEYLQPLRNLEAYSNIRVIYQQHAGVSVARNRGIEEATGKWIMFLDADDYLDTNTVKQIVKESTKFTGDIHIFTGGMDSSSGRIDNTTFLKEGIDYGKIYTDKIPLMEATISVGMVPVGYVHTFSLGSAYCKLFSKDFLKRNGIRFAETITFAEDTLFSLDTYHYAECIWYHDWYLYIYVDNSASVTRKFRPGGFSQKKHFFEACQEFMRAHDLEKELETAFYTRVQYETLASFRLEFFHPLNKDPEAGKKYRRILRQEPVRTAMKRRYIPGGTTWKSKLLFIMVKQGWGIPYKLFRGAESSRLKGE